ncbi:hypothetical protein BS78_02G055400 [Paspalum vaginatum]|nr:hypothetical protein BS78_02G055400 [Paspalum vaginatum]
MPPDYDSVDLVGASTEARRCSLPRLATATARRKLCLWYGACGCRWSNLFVFSGEHGHRHQVRGPRFTGKFPGRRATKEKVSSWASSLFGSQSSWSAMMFPRIQMMSG